MHKEDKQRLHRIRVRLYPNYLPTVEGKYLARTANDPNEATYYLNELTLQFVNARRYTVVDRSDIDAVLAEQDFQLSYADDNAMVSIGKFIGAQVVITGSISGTGPQKRLIIKAIDVLTSEILSMVPVGL